MKRLVFCCLVVVCCAVLTGLLRPLLGRDCGAGGALVGWGGFRGYDADGASRGPRRTLCGVCRPARRRTDGPRDGRPLLRALLGRAEANEEAFYLFGELCEKYLYAPDSPCRDEELYRYALLTVVESDRLDDYRKLRPRYQLNMIGRNRVGGAGRRT